MHVKIALSHQQITVIDPVVEFFFAGKLLVGPGSEPLSLGFFGNGVNLYGFVTFHHCIVHIGPGCVAGGRVTLLVDGQHMGVIVIHAFVDAFNTSLQAFSPVKMDVILRGEIMVCPRCPCIFFSGATGKETCHDKKQYSM